MSHFLCRRLRFHVGSSSTEVAAVATSNVYLFLQGNPLSKSFSNISENPVKTTAEPSSTISYLINSCGLSPESAVSVSKLVCLGTQEKADSVLSCFSSHGFTKAQISEFIAKCPSLLGCDPGKTLKPKFEFFQSYGIIGPTLVKIINFSPSLLKRSLRNQIIPNINFLKTFLLTDKAVVDALQRSAQILQLNLQNKMIPNVLTLRNHGVPDFLISKLMANYPRTLALKSHKFSATVNVIKEMGFNPNNSAFATAVRVKSTMSESTWDRKVALYQSLGWSEAEVLSAFKKLPLCMMKSEDKIKRSMGFFAQWLGMKPSIICQYPILLSFSLEKRVMPRCWVMEFLLSKGLIKRCLHIVSVLLCTEKDFRRKFVNEYQDAVPELPDIYQGKVVLEGLEQVAKICVF